MICTEYERLHLERKYRKVNYSSMINFYVLKSKEQHSQECHISCIESFSMRCAQLAQDQQLQSMDSILFISAP